MQIGMCVRMCKLLNVHIVMGTKTTKIAKFPNQDKNKGRPNSKSKSLNKRNKNKNMIIVR